MNKETLSVEGRPKLPSGVMREYLESPVKKIDGSFLGVRLANPDLPIFLATNNSVSLKVLAL